MRIVSREILASLPNGTLFCQYHNGTLQNDWNVITGHYEKLNGENTKVGFISTLPLSPFIVDNGGVETGNTSITNWSTIDTCDYDYDDDQLFAVMSKTEIRAMITVLQYALSNCGFPIYKFMDTYYCGDEEIDEKDLDDWIGE